MNDNKRGNILSNITEDVSELLREECVSAGRAALYRNWFDSPDWCNWRYNHGDDQPDGPEEYALGNSQTKGTLKTVPDWASRKAVYEFFRDMVERDFETYMSDRKEDDNGDA